MAVLVADPGRLEDVPPAELPELIGQVEALKAQLWARLQASAAPPSPPTSDSEPDRLLTADEAAERLGVDRRWVYRHQEQLPFRRKLAAGTLRFSERGLERWQARKS